MMIRVRNETEALTVGRQVPWDQSNLREQFYFTEQQVLDPAQLSASLSQILSDPDRQAETADRTRLKRSADGGVDRRTNAAVGQRTTGPQGPARQHPQTQVASLPRRHARHGGIGPRNAHRRDDRERDTGRKSDRSGAQHPDRIKTAWLLPAGSRRRRGKGSQRALGDYYRNTKQSTATTDQASQLLGDLFLRSGRICKQPVIVRR